MMLNIHVDEKTYTRLMLAAAQLGRTINDLAECAVSEAALDWDRSQPRPVSENQRVSGPSTAGK